MDSTKVVINKWSSERTKKFILLRKKWRHLFRGKKGSAKLGWIRVAQELPFQGKWMYLQKKWQNLMQKYKEISLAASCLGAGGEKIPITWQFYDLMEEVNRGERLPMPAPLVFDSALHQIGGGRDHAPTPLVPAALPLRQPTVSVLRCAVPCPRPPMLQPGVVSAPRAFVSLLRNPAPSSSAPYPTAIYASPRHPNPFFRSPRPTSFIIISKPPSTPPSSAAAAVRPSTIPGSSSPRPVHPSAPPSSPPSNSPLCVVIPTKCPGTEEAVSSVGGTTASTVFVAPSCPPSEDPLQVASEALPLPPPPTASSSSTSPPDSSEAQDAPRRASSSACAAAAPPVAPSVSSREKRPPRRRKGKRTEEKAEDDFFRYMKAREEEHTAIMRSALQILTEIRDEIKKENG